MQRLVQAFNPAAALGLMCRNTLSVGWDGRLYDCDFNQMLELGVRDAPQHISEFDFQALARREDPRRASLLRLHGGARVLVWRSHHVTEPSEARVGWCVSSQKRPALAP